MSDEKDSKEIVRSIMFGYNVLFVAIAISILVKYELDMEYLEYIIDISLVLFTLFQLYIYRRVKKKAEVQ